MKKLILPFLILLLIGTSAQVASAQDTTLVDQSLKGQYEFMLSRSKTLYGFKLINPVRIAAFYKSAADSIRKEKARNKTSQSKIKEQNNTINTLNEQIKTKENALASTNSKVDEISLLGIPFSKATYNLIVWTLIIVLAVLLAIVTLRSAKSIQEAKYRTGLYDEISQEYQAYKTKANDKEKKLARELQDERNKLEDYKNSGRI